MGYIASMSDTQKHNPNPKDKYGLQELTAMQRAFCEYLVMNEGRTTNKDAAIHAGYSEKNAAVDQIAIALIFLLHPAHHLLFFFAWCPRHH